MENVVCNHSSGKSDDVPVYVYYLPIVVVSQRKKNVDVGCITGRSFGSPGQSL